MSILDYLQHGAGNAVTAEKLAEVTGLDVRTVRNLVQLERMQGVPICARNEDPFGYFIAECPNELQDYVHSLKRRLRSIYTTYISLVEVLDEMSGQERIDVFFCDKEDECYDTWA